MLLFTCSPRLDGEVDSLQVGRANRFLHFMDMQHLKSCGCGYYDWGGVCVDPNDPRYPIGTFKLSLGGTLIQNATLKTPLYRLCEILRSAVARVKLLIVRRGE